MLLSFHFRAIFAMVLSTLVLTSCQEQDDIYGSSPDEYAPSGNRNEAAAAARYFDQKEVACVTAKDDLTALLPNGWTDVSLLNRNPKGNLEQLPFTGNVFASMRLSYEAATGGLMRVTTINSLGYEKSFTLYPCNVRDSYFYILDYDGTTLVNVYAFSIDSRDVPSAADLGHEASLQVRDRAVGIGFQRGAPTQRTVMQTLGNVHYVANLLRNTGQCNGTNDRYFLGNKEENGFRSCTGGTINGEKMARLGAFLNLDYDAVEIWTQGNENIQINSSRSPFSKQMPVYVYRGNRILHQFNGWVEAKRSMASLIIRL